MATQTGSIDLTASNSVKLAAEAGWQSDLDEYYKKSEIDLTVEGINADVTEIVDGLTQSSHFTQTATGFEFTLDDALADAEKTATNYIGIDSTGIRIANANPNTTTTYQHQSATSTEFVVDGNSMAEISGNGARFGVNAAPHLELSSSRMILTESNDSLNSRPRFDVNARDTYYSDPFDIPSSALSTGLTVKIAGGFIKVTPAALSIGDSSRTDESDATLLAGTSMVRVGKAGESHVVVSQDAITMLDANGNVFMDVRDNGLYQTRTYTLTADGYHSAVFPDPQPMLIKDSETDVTITVDGVPYEYGVDVTFDKHRAGDVVTLYDVWFRDPVPAAGSTIVVTFRTESDKTYTLGKRTDDTTEGPYSFVEGYNNEASGYMSHAEGGECSSTDSYAHSEGSGCIASHLYAHAEGCSTTASERAAHSEGWGTIASGGQSHAQNHYTIAASFCQTALGRYNVADANSTYAVIVGNGTNDSHRSNALTVGWDGNIMAQAMAGIVQMFAGATPPIGWLECDGSAVSRETYATLFAAIGTTWGAGDGSTTFNLPDLRGRAPIGAGTGSGLSARTLGNKVGTENAVIPYHTHSIPNHVHTMSHTHPSVSGGRAIGYNGGSGTGQITTGVTALRATAASSGTHYVPQVANESVDFSGFNNTGASSAANTGNPTSLPNVAYAGTSGNTTGANMQPSAVVKFIICTGKTS